MLIPAGVLLGVLLVPVLGAVLGTRSADRRLHSRWLVPYALVLQVLALDVVGIGPRPAVLALIVSSFLLAGVFVWRNRAVAGLPLVAARSLLGRDPRPWLRRRTVALVPRWLRRVPQPARPDRTVIVPDAYRTDARLVAVQTSDLGMLVPEQFAADTSVVAFRPPAARPEPHTGRSA